MKTITIVLSTIYTMGIIYGLYFQSNIILSIGAFGSILYTWALGDIIDDFNNKK